MLFYSLFNSLIGKQVVVELKNDLAIRGTLHSVDQYLNIKLKNISVEDEDSGETSPLDVCAELLHPWLSRELNPADVDVELMQDSSRVEAREQKKS